MPDNKDKTDNRDRLRVAGGEDYEVAYLAEEAKITPEEARDLIKRFGNDRSVLMSEATRLREKNAGR